MKRLLLLTIGLIAASSAMARLIPEDGQTQWRWVIDASMPEDIVRGKLIDLSDAPITRAYLTRYSVYGDTLVCRSLPGMRDWFVLRGESLWTVGANDRITRHAFSHGVPYLPSDFTPSACSATDTVTVSATDSPDRSQTVESTLTVGPGPGFILAPGDTVRRTVEVAEIRVSTAAEGVSLTTVDRRWYADGRMFPVVEETGITGGYGQYATLTVCPPSEQPGADTPRSRGDGIFGAPPRPGDDRAECTGIVRQGDMITAAGVQDDGALRVSVCDMQGRVMRAGQGEVPVGGLPPGWYIITLTGNGGGYSVKFRID